MKLSDLGEGGLLDLLRDWTGGGRSGIALGPGDDAALLELPDQPRQVVVSTDAWREGVHFRRDWLKPDEIGHRAMAGSLSDLAAMAADPLAAFINVYAPEDLEVEFLRGVYLGMDRIADACGVSIAGGDLVRGDFSLGITVVGSVVPGRAIRRDGARPGEVLCVSGELGRSEAGRRLISGEVTFSVPPTDRAVAEAGHRTPRPRFDIAKLLQNLERRVVDLEAGRESYEPARPTALMDISDGLALDLTRMCEASGVGCRLDEDRIPVDKAAAAIARVAKLPEASLALGGGEDFELLFTVAPDTLDLLLGAADKAGCVVTPIGRMVPVAEGRMIVDRDGKARPLESDGWDHFRVKTDRSSTDRTPTPRGAVPGSGSSKRKRSRRG